jgi:2-iminobutanoate/2-iminopropanoate deaminase
MNREIRSKMAPPPIGPYSQAVEATQPSPGSEAKIFCSGQVGIDPATGSLEEGVTAQTRRALLNLDQVLRSANSSLGDVVKTTVFMVDLGEFSLMNEEYAKHFPAPFPARSTVQVAALPRGARVEIEAVAVRG